MRFSVKEITAMVKMGIVMAKSDDDFADEEVKFIAKEILSFGISEQQAMEIVKNADDMEGAELFQIMTSLTKEEQKYVCGFMAVIMLADGEIKDSEVEAWQKLCTLLSFPTMSVKEAIDFWKNN